MRQGPPVLSIESTVGRSVESGELRKVRSRSVYRLQWEELDHQRASDSSRPVLATLGEVGAERLQAERYADLPALLEGVDNGSPRPEIVLATTSLREAEHPEVAHECR